MGERVGLFSFRFFPIFICVLLLSARLCAEEPSLVLVDSDGKLYSLQESGQAPRWAPIDAGALNHPSFKLPQGERRSPGGKSRIITGSQVQVNFGSGWEDSALAPATGAFHYTQAHIDALGNTFVELGGAGRGFNFVGKGGRPVIISKNISFGGDPISANPSFKKVIANPYGPGILGLTSGGRLLRIDPPTTPRGPFHVTELAADDEVADIALGATNILVSRRDGKIGLLKNGAPLKTSFDEVALPNGIAKGDVKIFSSALPLAGESVKSALISTVERKSARSSEAAQPPPPLASSHLPPGHKIEKRNGRLEQIDAKGNIVKRPPSVLHELIASGDPAFEPFLEGIGGTKGVVNDRIALERHLDKDQEIFGRSKEVARAFDILVRSKGKNPILTGDAGVGKTAIAQLIAQKVMDGQIPEALEFQQVLKGALVVQTTPAQISRLAKANDPTSQAAAVEMFLNSLKAAEEKLGRRIILYIDEMHMFSPGQLEALKTSLDSKDGILFLGSTTGPEYQQMIKRNDALRRRFQEVDVREFGVAETRELLKKTVVPQLERIYRGKNGPGKITDEAVDAAISHAVEYLPHSARPEGPFKLLQDAMIAVHREAGENAPTLEKGQVGRVVANALNLPFDPTNPKTVMEGFNKIKAEMRETVIDQHRLTDRATELMRDAFLAAPGQKMHRVLLVGGPTGAGKTFSAKALAKKVFDDDRRVLEIDANQYKTGGLSLNALLGSPPGTVDSEYQGELLEFLDSKGKGANLIVINELDKAPKELMEALMELIDTGKMTRNGRTYHLGRSLIMLTTNKGDEHIYPRGEGRALSRQEIDARLSSITASQIKKWFMEPDKNALDKTSELFHPSVLARIDDAVPAAPPSREGALKIARQEADRLAASLKENHRYEIRLDDSAIERLVDAHYIPEDGVRDLKRMIERLVNDAQVAAFSEADVKPNEVITVSLKKGKPGEPDSWSIGSNTKARTASLTAPNPRKIDNPLADPEERKKLASLEGRLAKRVYGQPDAVKMAAQGIRIKKVDTQSKQPNVMLLLGPTGTGKTELAIAIAAEAYGDPERMKTFDMSKIKWEGHLNKIFGSDPGFSMGNKTSPFEDFISKYEKEGAVLLWDEIGNMGGGNTVHEGSGSGANTKTELLQIFYEMVDKGYWVSPTGKKYDLSKFTFVFTSNEGQEWFQRQPSDDLRMATWKKQRSQEKLIEMLKEHGWPEPLLGRLEGNITLYKPLLKPEREFIAKKLFDSGIGRLTSQHGIGKISVDPGFYQSVAESFFSHTQGARSMRGLANKAFTDLITTALLDQYDPEALSHTDFHFFLKDSFAGKNRYPGSIPPEREVALRLVVTGPDGEAKEYTADVSSRAAEKRLQSNADVKATAIHEAGHAVVNDPKLTGETTDFITVESQGHYGGYARYEDVGKKMGYTRPQAVAMIGRLLAGQLAQKSMGLAADTGWASDIEQARKLAEEVVGRWALTDAALGLPVKNGKAIVESPEFQAEVRKVMGEGEKYALSRLKEQWPLLRLIAAELIRKGTIDRSRIRELEKHALRPEYLATLRENEIKLKKSGSPTASRQLVPCPFDKLAR